jgi:histidinol phosphatase-like PHP family hydrolase
LTIDIDTDAHISSDFHLLPYDIDKARLGRLSQESVFNAPGVDGLQTVRKR